MLLVAVLLLFAPALRHPDYLLYPTYSPHSDLTVSHWPKAYLMAQTWEARRSLPLWTPANLSGMPLAANQVAMRFYPPAWLFSFLPINPVFNLLYVFHLFWGGLGLYCLLRVGFDVDSTPALAGALSFALSGKLLAHIAGGHVIVAAAMAWMPWALLGTHQLLRDGRLSWAALAGLALALQIATDIRITLYTAYLLLAYALWELLVVTKQPRLARWRLAVPRLVTVPLLAVLLGAAQFLPLLELSGYSNRGLSLQEAGRFAMTPLTLLVGLLLPNAQGGHEMVVYLGLVPVVLAFLTLRRADRRIWFFVGLVLFALVYALGPATPLFELVYRLLPGFGWVRAPARIFFPASLAVAVLAGLGMQRLAQGQVRCSISVAVAIGMLTTSLGLGLAIFFGQVNRAALGLACLPSLSLLVVGLAARQRLPTRQALPLLTAILFIDLASFDVTAMRFISPAEAFADGAAAANYLASQSGLFRTYSPSYSLPSHVAARAGLQTADGVEGVHLAAYDRFMALAGGYDDPGFSVTLPPFPPGRPLDEAHRETRPDLRLLGLLNVEYLVAAYPMDWPGLSLVAEVDGTYIYRNEHVLPRAWLLDSSVPAGDEWPGQLTALADRAAQAVAGGGYTVNVTRYDPDRIEVTVQSPGDAILILGEIWYPGWRAVVDGEVKPVEQVAGVLRGVPLTKGVHHVALVYDPASVRWGTRLSLTGLAILVLWMGLEIWRWAQTKPA
ncbi:MAG: YfhO family protein [Anaerolineae bacterium]